MPLLKIKGLRWWMIGLVMLGAIINYLTRSTLAVSAPTLLKELNITTQEYSYITATFQGAIMLQPLCGYVLDTIGLKFGFAIFATAWSIICMAHGLATNWQALAFLRGLLGLAEGSANPAGMKAAWRAVFSILAHPSAPCWRRRWWCGPFCITTGSLHS
jgi:ACS family hexuronate transporter-like MFS transporter